VGRLFLSIVSVAVQTNNDKIRKKNERPAVIQKTKIITEAKSSQGKNRPESTLRKVANDKASKAGECEVIM